MEPKLKVAKDLSIPAFEFVESATAILGKRGRGKTGLVKVLMEELVDANLPFVAFDPVGVMWGVKSSVDGRGPGKPVLIIGGAHGDLRLDRRAGAEIARSVVEANVSCVIDFSEESKNVYREFVRDFSHTLFHINDSPRVVIVEEAPELVPQKLRPDMTEVFEAVERLVSRGRNKLIGVVLVSQRAQTINKDVLTQADTLFIFGLVSPQDRKAIEEWVEAWDVKDKLGTFMDELAALVKQECWVWSPEKFNVFKRIRVRDFTTFHADKTHLRALGLLKAKPVTTDVSNIVAKLGKSMERLAKTKDEQTSVTKLQLKVRQLEAELDRQRVKVAKPSSLPKADLMAMAKEIAERGIDKERKAILRAAMADMERVRTAVRRAVAVLADVANPQMGKSSITPLIAEAAARSPIPEKRIAMPVRQPMVVRSRAVVQAPEPTTDGEIRLAAGALRMLKALAQRYPLTLTRYQLGTLAGFTASGGTFGNYFGMLKKVGYIQEDAAGNVSVTDTGLEAAGEVPSMPTSRDEIMDMWKRALPSGAMKMLETLVESYPDAMSREELGERSGFAASGGTFGNYLGMLRNNGLITVNGQDVRAADVLFPEASA